MSRSNFALTALVFAVGCSSGRPAADVERGKQAVIVGLDAWKLKQPLNQLNSSTDVVQFTEELRANYILTDYMIGKVDASDKEVLRYTVTLNLKDKKGKVSRREVVYAVLLGSSIVVSRDPYF